MRITASTTGQAGKWSKRPLVNEELMREVGDLQLSRIRRRTGAGVDVDGSAFQALSPDYAKQKAAAVGSTRADLSVSGRMLNEMTIIGSSRNTVTLGFIGGAVGAVARATGGTFIQRSRSVAGADKALYHNVTGAGRSRVIRRFFGLSSDDGTTIRDAVQKFLDRMSGR